MRYTLLLFLFLFVFHPLSSQHLDFGLTAIIGTPVNKPRDVAIDKDGNMFVLEENNLNINKIDSTGRLVEKIPIGIRIGMRLELDKAGNIYVSDYDEACVKKFDPKGKPLLKVGKRGTGPGAFQQVGPLALDEQENVYVADGRMPRVQKFNAQGQLLQQFGPGNSAADSLHFVVDVDLDAQGNVYILDGKNTRVPENAVLKFSPSGKLLQKFYVSQPGPSYNTNRAISMTVAKNGGFYIVYSFSREILQYDAQGGLIRKFAGHGLSLSGLAGEPMLAQDDAGNVYAADNYHIYPNIKKYAANGTFLRQYGHDKKFSSLVYGQHGTIWVYEANKNEIHLYDAAGNLKLKFRTTDSPESPSIQQLLALDGQGNIYALKPGIQIKIKKFTSKGILITEFTPVLPKPANNGIYPRSLAIDRAGYLYIADANGGVILRVDPTGKYAGTIGKPGTGPGELSSPRSAVLDGLGFIYIQDVNGNRIQKFSPAGQFLMAYNDPSAYSDYNFSNLSVDQHGNAFLSFSSNYSSHLKIFNRSGQLQKQLEIGTYGIAVSPSGEAFATQIVYNSTIGIYTSKDKRLQSSFITGNIFEDPDGNCALDNTKKGMAGIPVIAEPGPYYGISDDSGNYVIAVDTGRYTVSPVLPREPGRTITPTCPPALTQPVVLERSGSSVPGPSFGNQVSIAPFLTVQVASNRRRRCFRNITTVCYANTGFAPAPGAKVTVQLPEYVSFISASMPHTRDAKGNYLFAVGDLQPNQRGLLTLVDSVSCADPDIRGLTVCTKAWITPANAYPAPPNWNRADISVSGKTLANGQVRFVIRNNGVGDMTDSLLFRVYQDAQLALVDKYNLPAQDSLVLRFAPTGRVVRVEVDQPDGHPIKAFSGTNVEVKPRLAAAQLPAIPMMAFPSDDPEPEIALDCLPIIDSFDPNDKQVVPAGLTAERYTPTNSPLRYTIRFQNTGTDLAYRVVVVDTLSADLDLSTLQVSAVSHRYRLAVTGKTRPVLTFTFDNILLPDSARDQAGSNGFVQFSIKPKSNLPAKASIENYADIFFDYNEPVRTNTTLNRIYDLPLELNAEHQLSAGEVITSPAVTGFWPAQSRAGAVVRLAGRHFAAAPAGNQVSFNGVGAPVLSATDSVLTVLVPANAFSGKIKVATPDGAAQSGSDYIIFQPPTITAVSATEGVPGTVVTLTGTHFSPVATQDTVTFSGVAARVVAASPTSLQVEVPAGATWGKILVKTLGGQVESPAAFMVWYPPVITDFSPGKAKAGTRLVLRGEHFAHAAARSQVLFGTAPAQVLEASASRLLVQVPEAASSGRIRLQTPGGMAFSPAAFTFIPAPEIMAFTPARANAGATVTLTGQHFLADGQTDTVYFNDLPAKVLKATQTLLQVQAPKGVRSGSITVAGAGGRAVVSGFEVPDLLPQEAIEVYPNPTQAAITINWFKADFTVESLRVYNAIGKLVAEQDAGAASNNELQLSLSRFGSGIYLLHFQSSAGPVIKRVMVL